MVFDFVVAVLFLWVSLRPKDVGKHLRIISDAFYEKEPSE